MCVRTRWTAATSLRGWAWAFIPRANALEELRSNVKEAVDCYFDEAIVAPKVIRLHFVRDEVLAR